MRRRLLGAARRLGVERQALAVRRRLLPARVRADIRDHELLVALLEELLEPDSKCLDVGCHEGSVLREIVRIAPLGTHIAWEPLPAMAHALRDEFPSVEIRQAALSDRAGERQFAHVVDEPGWSGFVARPTPGGGPVEMLTVRCERLDESLPEDFHPTLIKIDVEGAEEQVLAGATDTLSRHRPIVVFEHGAGSADHYGTTPGRIHGLLAGGLGYRIYGLDGDGPYDAASLEGIFARGERVNFIARP